jgi:hypothetical protein
MKRVVVVLLLVAGAAWASPEKERAAASFERGLAAFNAGNFEDALTHFQAAHQLLPRFQVLLNIAVTESRLGRYNDAATTFRRYLREGATAIPPERRAQVEQELATMRTSGAELAINADGTPVDVTVDGIGVGRTPLEAPVLVRPGRHVVRGTRAGDDPATELVDVAAGAHREVVLDFDTEAAPQQDPPQARLTVRSIPEGARITVDGRIAGRSPWSGALAPGPHEITAELRGNTAGERVVLVPGEVQALALSIAMPVEEVDTPPPPPPSRSRAGTITLVCILVTGLAVGLGFGIWALYHAEQPPSHDFTYPY